MRGRGVSVVLCAASSLRLTAGGECAQTMFSDVRNLQSLYVVPIPNTINTYAEPQNALGVTPNRVANSNEMAGNNSCAPAFTGVCPLPLAETKAGSRVFLSE